MSLPRLPLLILLILLATCGCGSPGEVLQDFDGDETQGPAVLIGTSE